MREWNTRKKPKRNLIFFAEALFLTDVHQYSYFFLC